LLRNSGWAELQSAGGPRTIANRVTGQGILRVSGPADFTFTNNVSITAVDTNGPTVTLAGPLVSDFTKTGSGRVIVSATAPVNANFYVNGGTLRFDSADSKTPQFSVSGGGTLEFGCSQSPLYLAVHSGATVRLAAGRDKFVVTSRLVQDAGGTIDLTDNAFALDYTGTSPLNTIAAQVRLGYAGGTWGGTGFRSSTAAVDGSLGIGFAEASETLGPNGGTFLGQAVDGTAILLRTTLRGDATLDGVVDFNDLVKLAQSYNSTSASLGWVQGDFNYDGAVDFADLVALAQNYNAGLPPEPAGASADFSHDLAAAFANVPEASGTAALLTVSMRIGLRRRRRVV
jgi:autotransporter-associated beta strand protein